MRQLAKVSQSTVPQPTPAPLSGSCIKQPLALGRHLKRCGQVLAVSTALVLAACGGGDPTDPFNVGSDPAANPSPSPAPGPTPGGSDSVLVDPTPAPAPGSAPASYSVSGSITVAESSALDADTNDVNQVNRKGNGTFETAQTIKNPVRVVGYLNMPGQGPDGASKTDGDVIDGYKVSLQAGQVVEVEFSAEPGEVDVDLYVYNSARVTVGVSDGRNSFECVEIAADGDYFLSAELFEPASSGGTVYQLRIGASGTGASCANRTGQIASVIPGEVIVHAAGATSTATTKLTKSTITGSGRPVVLKGVIAPGRSALLQVPVDLDAWRGLAKSTSGVRVKALRTKAEEGKSSATLDLERTLKFAKLLSMSPDYSLAMANRWLKTSQSVPVGAFPPNDRDYQRQRWHYEAIELPAAMAALAQLSPAPSRRPVVAVLDSGIVADHPDLSEQIVRGYDFVKDGNSAGDGNSIDADPNDDADTQGASFHGSHVAGTVAAETFNGVGGAGVAPMARIMPVRVIGTSGGGSFYDIEQGIKFATGQPNDSGTVPDQVADVVNMSLGAEGNCDPASDRFFRSLSETTGAIFVAASGNESRSSQLTPVGFPANCPSVIAVGAINAQNTRAQYSNGGAVLDLVAPGGDTSQSTTGNGLPDGVYSTIATFNGGRRVASYAMFQGTSMATPHAAGIFALMRYVAPNLTLAQIESLITSGKLTNDLGSAGKDNSYGYGLLSARKAVVEAIAIGGGQTPAPPVGRIEALPSTLNLGESRAEVEFELRAVGDTAARVASVTVDSQEISVRAKSATVDAQTGLGTYIVSENRSRLALGTSSFPSVVVRLSSGDELRIPVSIQRPGVGDTLGGNLGPIYVLVLDADNLEAEVPLVQQTQILEPVNGRYNFTVPRVPGVNRILVIAGSDTDNDNFVCGKGEACGAYPVLGNGAEIIEPRGSVNNIDFSLAPIGGISSQAFSAAVRGLQDRGIAVNSRTGWRRTPSE